MPAYRTVNLSDIALKGLLGVAVAGGAVLPLAPSAANAASVRKEIVIDAPPEFVWNALRDFGALHTRLVRGFVTDTRLDGEARIVTFANGSVARELLVDIDDEAMRLVYAVDSERLIAHSASAQVFIEVGGKTRVVWMADFLPNEIEPYISGQMEIGAAAMKNTLEEDAAKQRPRQSG
ncbi:MAG: SRPBCC family protein [Amphiplicatus sp.]